MNSIVYLETIWQDVFYALRALSKNPAFALTAVLTLALGIGGDTAIFTLIHSVLLKPLEYREPDRLVYLSAENARRNMQELPFTLIRLEEMRAATRSFSGIGAFLSSAEDMTLSDGDPEALKAARVSANFLDILGVQPVLGRSFLPEEDTPGGRSVAMISTSLWKRRFGGDPQMAGKTVTLNSTPYTITGVLPASFAFPFAGVDVWVTRPSEWSRFPPQYWRTVTFLKGFARLKPGVSLEQARAEMDVLNHQYLLAHPDFGAVPGVTMRVVWLKDRVVANVRPMLLFLFGAVGFVLLIACVNVASLMLARATSRSRELAVRAALGAGRGRLIRQLLAESLVLAIVGGMFGVLLARWGLSAIAHINVLDSPARMGALFVPGAAQIRVDGTVLGFTLALSITTGVLFGLFPSLRVSRPNLVDALRESGATAGLRAVGRRGVFGVGTRSVLVIGQVALSIVLLIGATLLMESMARLHSVNPGFQTANLLTMKIALPTKCYDTEQKKVDFFEQLVERTEAIPGVDSATAAMSLPTTPWIWTDIRVEGQPLANPNEVPTAQLQSVTPGYFRTLKIPLQRGREFTKRDNNPSAPRVVMINETLARRFWPSYPRGQNPIGQHISEGADKSAGWLEIVGIVSNVHEGGLAVDPGPEFYVPSMVHPPQTAYLVARTKGDRLQLINAIRIQVHTIDRDQPISEVKNMQALFDTAVGQKRLTAVLLGTFAAMGLLLALIGVYGIIGYSVVQRTQEIGVRRALGAQRADILRLMLTQGLRLALFGGAIGIGGAFALNRVMKGLLFGVSATDPVTFVSVAMLFAAVALLASYIPARRATRIDPMKTLRVG